MSIFSKIFSSKAPGEYIYHVENIDIVELKECKVGDYLKIWFPEDKSLINLYRLGTYSGIGRVGNITGKFMKTILQHFNSGDDVEAEIIEISEGNCKVKWVVTTAEKIKQETDSNISKIKEELSKPYSPKKSFIYELYIREKFELRSGAILSLNLDNLDEIESDLENIEIPIYHNELLIGEITSQTVCRKVLRAFYSSYETNLIITEIVEQGGNLRRVNINIEFRKLAAVK